MKRTDEMTGFGLTAEALRRGGDAGNFGVLEKILWVMKRKAPHPGPLPATRGEGNNTTEISRPHSGSLPASGERGQGDAERHVLSPIYVCPARVGGRRILSYNRKRGCGDVVFPVGSGSSREIFYKYL
jgi:hypothetical protein